MARSSTTPRHGKDRVIDAARELFRHQGVGATSLQMIADEMGVTKAAVYYHYRTKDEIVLAVAEAELATLRSVIEKAEAEPTGDRARDALILDIVDLAIAGRRTMSAVLADPAIVGLFHDHEDFREVMLRMRRVLTLGDMSGDAKVRTAMLVAALSGAATNPMLAGMPDRELRGQLVRLARSFLELPG